MRIISWKDPDYAERMADLAAPSSLFDRGIEQRARAIVEEVQVRGDAALIEFTEKFDGARLTPDFLAVTKAELFSASAQAGDELRQAVRMAVKNIEFFSRQSMRRNWSAKNEQGASVGEKFDPFQRVGIYIPGGTAPLVSTALMTIVLAQVAECPEIVVCTPCGRDSQVNPALLFAARHAGATEIYKVGGAQAIAALAFGTETIRPVQKIFGPGNAYVVAAKRLLFGRVSIDLLPGPSEVLVLADETAEPRFIAADMLAQAEHGSGHERVWLVTPSRKLLRAVERELKRQLKGLSRAEFIERALEDNGFLVQVRSQEEAIALANQVAPEHCEIMMRGARSISKQVVTAGAIFLGPNSPTVLGDYVAGPSHTLPTGGAGRSFAGLTVDQFQRRTSVVEYGKAALKASLATVEQFAAMEGLDAHGRSAAVRLERRGTKAKQGRKS